MSGATGPDPVSPGREWEKFFCSGERDASNDDVLVPPIPLTRRTTEPYGSFVGRTLGENTMTTAPGQQCSGYQ